MNVVEGLIAEAIGTGVTQVVKLVSDSLNMNEIIKTESAAMLEEIQTVFFNASLSKAFENEDDIMQDSDIVEEIVQVFKKHGIRCFGIHES